MAQLKYSYQSLDEKFISFLNCREKKVLLCLTESVQYSKQRLTEVLKDRERTSQIRSNLSNCNNQDSFELISSSIFKSISENKLKENVVLVLTGFLGKCSLDWFQVWSERNQGLIGWDQLKVIVISRSCDLYLQQADYQESFIPIVDGQFKEDWVEQLEITPLKRDQILQLIKVHVSAHAMQIEEDEYIRYMNCIPGMMDLLSHEVFLMIYLKNLGLWLKRLRENGTALIEGEKVKVGCVKYLCHELLGEWHRMVAEEEAHETNTSELMQDYLELSQELAGAIGEFGKENKGFSREQMLECIYRAKNPSYLLSSMRGVPIQLVKRESEKYEFRFQSDLLFNYLKNERRNQIKKLGKNERKLRLFKCPLTILEAKNDSEWITDEMNSRALEGEEMKYYAEQLRREGLEADELRAKLLGWVYRTRYGQEYSVGGRNAVTILNYGSYDFSEKNFTGISIPGSDLENSILNRTKLNNSNLSSVNFFKSFLGGSDLSDANLKNAKFGSIGEFSEKTISVFIYQPKYDRYIIGTNDGYIYIFHMESNICKVKYYKKVHNGKVTKLIINEDDDGLYSSSIDRTICLMKLLLSSFEILYVITIKDTWVCDLAFHRKSRQLFACCEDGTITCRSGENFGLLQYIGNHENVATCIDAHPTKKNIVVSGGNDNCIIFWNISDNTYDKINLGETIKIIKFSESGRFVACGSAEGNLFVAMYNQIQERYSEFSRISSHPTEKPLKALAFYKDDILYASARLKDGYIYLLNNEKQILTLKAFEAREKAKDACFINIHGVVLLIICYKNRLRIFKDLIDLSDIEKIRYYFEYSLRIQSDNNYGMKSEPQLILPSLNPEFKVEQFVNTNDEYLVILKYGKLKTIKVKRINKKSGEIRMIPILDSNVIYATVSVDRKLACSINKKSYSDSIDENYVFIHDIDDANIFVKVGFESCITSLVFYKKNYLLCGSFEGYLYLIDILSGEIIRKAKLSNKRIENIHVCDSINSSEIMVETYEAKYFYFPDIANDPDYISYIFYRVEDNDFDPTRANNSYCDFKNKRVAIIDGYRRVFLFSYSTNAMTQDKNTPLFFTDIVSGHALCIGKSKNVLIVGDHIGFLYVYDLRSLKLAKYKMHGTAIHQIIEVNNNVFISVSLETDNYYIWRLNKNNQPTLLKIHGESFGVVDGCVISDSTIMSEYNRKKFLKYGAKLKKSIRKFREIKSFITDEDKRKTPVLILATESEILLVKHLTSTFESRNIVHIDLSECNPHNIVNYAVDKINSVIKDILKSSHITLVLSGILGESSLDWLSVCLNTHNLAVHLEQLNIIVIARSCDLLIQQENYLESFIPIIGKEYKEDWVQEIKFESLSEKELEDELENAFTESYKLYQKEEFLQYIYEIPGMKSLLRYLPFLNIFIEKIESWVDKLREDKIELKHGKKVESACVKYLCHELLIEWYTVVAEVEISNASINDELKDQMKQELIEAYQELSEELAGAMSESKSFSREQVLESFDQAKDSPFAKKCLRGIPLVLKRGEDGKYEFKFQSDLIFNYLVHQHNTRLKRVLRGQNKWILFPNPLKIVRIKKNEDWLKDEFNRRLLDREEMEYYAEQLRSDSDEKQELQKKLLAWIYRTRRGKQYAVGGRNAISILNYSGYNFSGYDLRRINIEHAKLEKGLFHKSKFDESDLTFVDFTDAFLIEATFNNTIIKDVQLGKIAFIVEKYCGLARFSGNLEYILFITRKGRYLKLSNDSGEILSVLAIRPHCFDINGDGSKSIFFDSSDTLQLWLKATGRSTMLYNISDPNERIYCLAIDARGETAVVCDMTGTVKIISIVENTKFIILREYKFPERIMSVTISRIGDRIVGTTYSGQIVICENDDIRYRILQHSVKGRISLSRKGDRFLTIHENDIVALWEWDKPDPILQVRHTMLTDICLHPGGTSFASVDYHHCIKFWDENSNHPTKIIKLEAPISAISFGQISDSFVVLTQRGMIKHFSVSKTSDQKNYSGHLSTVNDVLIIGDGKCIYSCSSDGTVRCWRPGVPRSQGDVFNLEDELYAFSTTSDESFVAVTAFGRISVWEKFGENPVFSIKYTDDIKSAICFKHSRKEFILVHGTSISIYSINGVLISEQFLTDSNVHIPISIRNNTLLLTEDDQKIVYVEKNTVYVFHLNNLREYKKISYPQLTLQNLSINFDASIVATASRFGGIEKWKLIDNHYQPTFLRRSRGIRNLEEVQINREGTYIAGTDKARQEIHIWNENDHLIHRILCPNTPTSFQWKFFDDRVILCAGFESGLVYAWWGSKDCLNWTLFWCSDQVNLVLRGASVGGIKQANPNNIAVIGRLTNIIPPEDESMVTSDEAINTEMRVF